MTAYFGPEKSLSALALANLDDLTERNCRVCKERLYLYRNSLFRIKNNANQNVNKQRQRHSALHVSGFVIVG